MKAPKNFYNTVDQSKLGIDDLFTRTAENEADITALETVVGDLDEGLVKDVHDLQDDSRRYHDDIADLKNADILINNRIDGHLLKETTTSADEGKIMSVNSNGEWELSTLAGSDPFFVLTGKITSNNQNITVSGYSTWGDAFNAAIASGKHIIAVIRTSDNNYDYVFTTSYSTTNNTQMALSRVLCTKSGGVDNMAFNFFTIGPNTGITTTNQYSSYTPLIPAPTSADYGKFLACNANGVLVWETPTT